MRTLRIGVLGAARITPAALIGPARHLDGVEVVAIAARDRDRAERYAGRHGIGRVHRTYEDVLADPEVDAVYVPLPNGLHAGWTVRALEAGKHVLCEKPLTADEGEAREVEDASRAAGLVVMEAFHYRYHPLAARIREAAGTLGAIERVETSVCFPLPRFSDIRYRYDLAGGAMMDAGCYALHAQRSFGPGEPEVTGARALVMRHDGEVDRAMAADLRYDNGATGLARASLWSRTLLKLSVRVVGERGELKVGNFVLPHLPHRLVVRVDGRTTRERVRGETSYTHQLRAFACAVRGEDTNLTPPSDSVATMRLIDAVYRGAGLSPRAGRDLRREPRG